MTRDEIPNIAGGWLGTYYYRGMQSANSPVRFEASFTCRAGGLFDGTIQDDSRQLGTANVQGRQLGTAVWFRKGYLKVVPGGRTMRVEYEGAFSEDGNVLSGTWRALTVANMPIIGAHGTWEARRAWIADDEPEAVPENETISAIARELTAIGGA